jgi:hypothetical protein
MQMSSWGRWAHLLVVVLDKINAASRTPRAATTPTLIDD